MPSKDSKAEANYQEHPSGNEQCSACTMRQPPASCTAVAGHIVSRGWCTYFARKASRAPFSAARS